MRRRRKKVDDRESLTVIGKDEFGKVVRWGFKGLHQNSKNGRFSIVSCHKTEKFMLCNQDLGRPREIGGKFPNWPHLLKAEAQELSRMDWWY